MKWITFDLPEADHLGYKPGIRVMPQLVSDYTARYCVVGHIAVNTTTGVETLAYVEHGPYQNAMSLQRAKQNSQWRKMFATDECGLGIQIMYVYHDIVDVARAADKIIRQFQPVCNIKGARINSNRIRCIDTGQVFENASAVCRVFGIQPSNLSAHLAGKPNNKRCAGWTFRREV